VLGPAESSFFGGSPSLSPMADGAAEFFGRVGIKEFRMIGQGFVHAGEILIVVGAVAGNAAVDPVKLRQVDLLDFYLFFTNGIAIGLVSDKLFCKLPVVLLIGEPFRVHIPPHPQKTEKQQHRRAYGKDAMKWCHGIMLVLIIVFCVHETSYFLS
jgi:hypothetical protein